MKSDTSDLSFPFSIFPFQAKGKEENEDDGLKLMTDPQDPSFLLFDAKSLNRTKKIWVRLKRHHRRNRAKTILFFYCYDTKRTVVKRGQNPVSSYIQYPSPIHQSIPCKTKSTVCGGEGGVIRAKRKVHSRASVEGAEG